MVEFEGNENTYAAYSYDELWTMLWSNEPTPLYNAAKQWHGYRHDLADAANFLRRGASKLRTKWRSAGGEAYLTELQRQAKVLSDQADLADQNYHALQGAADAWADTLAYVEKLGEPRTHDGGPVDPDDPSSDVRQPAFAKAMRKLAKEQAAARESLVYLDASPLAAPYDDLAPGEPRAGENDQGPSEGSRGAGTGATPPVGPVSGRSGFTPSRGGAPTSVRPGGTVPRPGVGGVPGKPATRSPAASGGRTPGVIGGRQQPAGVSGRDGQGSARPGAGGPPGGVRGVGGVGRGGPGGGASGDSGARPGGGPGTNPPRPGVPGAPGGGGLGGPGGPGEAAPGGHPPRGHGGVYPPGAGVGGGGGGGGAGRSRRKLERGEWMEGAAGRANPAGGVLGGEPTRRQSWDHPTSKLTPQARPTREDVDPDVLPDPQKVRETGRKLNAEYRNPDGAQVSFKFRGSRG